MTFLLNECSTLSPCYTTSTCTSMIFAITRCQCTSFRLRGMVPQYGTIFVLFGSDSGMVFSCSSVFPKIFKFSFSHGVAIALWLLSVGIIHHLKLWRTQVSVLTERCNVPSVPTRALLPFCLARGLFPLLKLWISRYPLISLALQLV